MSSGSAGLGWPEEVNVEPATAEPSGLGWPQGSDGVHPTTEVAK